MIELEIDDQPYSNFLSVDCTKSIEELSGSFSFTATDADGTGFPVRVGSKCRVIVDGIAFITGFVDSVSPSEDASSHEVVIQGRDKTADIIDSAISAGSVELTTPVSLKKVIETVISAIGADIQVINTVEGIEDYTKEELVSAKAGQSAFEFIEKYARQRQVLLTTDGDGNVVITQGNPVESGFALVNDDTQPDSNIKTTTVTYDHSSRYRKYVVVSQGNLTALNNFSSVNVRDIVNTSSTVVEDTEIREGRILYIVAENASNKIVAKQRAEWEANIRKARSRTYSVTIQGYTIEQTGLIHSVNSLVQVNDIAASINAKMLVKVVAFSQSKSGSITSLDLVESNAYTLALEEPPLRSRTNIIGREFDIDRAAGGAQELPPLISGNELDKALQAISGAT